MSRLVLVLAGCLAAVGLVLAPTGDTTTSHACVNANELWFRAADGTRLVAHRFGGATPGAKTAVVMAHMSVGDLCQWVPFARRLARQKAFAFPFDFRGHGFSEGRQNHRRSAGDVVAAVRAVRALGATKVIVMGASLGGIAALVATPNLKPAIDGVVSVSGPAAIPGTLNALPAVKKLDVPTLYVASQGDQNPPYDFAADAQRLYDETATDDKRVELVPGALHGTFLVDGSAAVRKLLLAFVRDPAETVRS